ncbi:MAG: hypothetical protein J5933_01905 [Clostridia bacterium]|nr:hypothetical protein [Clostridia bacterium]
MSTTEKVTNRHIEAVYFTVSANTRSLRTGTETAYKTHAKASNRFDRTVKYFMFQNPED